MPLVRRSVLTRHLVAPFLKSSKTLKKQLFWLSNLPITVFLVHFWVHVKTTVAHRYNLLSKQLYAFDRATEDHSLRNFKFVEQSRQAVKFFILLEVGIVLSDTFKCQFISGLHKQWLGHILFLESFDLLRICCTEKGNLGHVHAIHNHLDYWIEVLWKKLINFV